MGVAGFGDATAPGSLPAGVLSGHGAAVTHELTSAVPNEGSEALRDLVRAREAGKQDQLRARHRLSKFQLRDIRFIND
jgi:hypothetical protein